MDRRDQSDVYGERVMEDILAAIALGLMFAFPWIIVIVAGQIDWETNFWRDK